MKKKKNINKEFIIPGFTSKGNKVEEEPGDLPGDLEAKGVFGLEIGTSEKFRKKAAGRKNKENLG